MRMCYPKHIKSYLCVTRSEGGLLKTVNKKVNYFFLNKRSTLDVNAIYKLTKYIKKHQINIIHAHSSSYFFAVCVKLIHPSVKIIWHNHYGNSEELKNITLGFLKLGSLFFSAIVSVNTNLKKWALRVLHCKKVIYFPNFVNIENHIDIVKKTQLKGVSGKRIVCLANLRPEKDHLNLLNAFELIVKKHPDWTLHLVGKNFEDEYSKSIFSFIKDAKLENKIFFYGSCIDVDYILQQSTIGGLIIII